MMEAEKEFKEIQYLTEKELSLLEDNLNENK
jgi:hypothetical protein